MRLPRFRLRTLIIAVALMGVAIPAVREGIRLRRLAHYYRQKAAEHAQMEVMYLGLAANSAKASAKAMLSAESLRIGRVPDDAAEVTRADLASLDALAKKLESGKTFRRDMFCQVADGLEDLARAQTAEAADRTKTAEHYARLRQKYENAARRPWLRVPPDPPPPE